MIKKIALPALVLTLGLTTGCATIPMGPQVVVMPAPGKPYSQFLAEDRYCRDVAAQSIGMSPSETGAQNAVGGAVVGTIIGAAAGAALGGHDGAAVGAGMGLLAGSVIGSEQGAYAMDASQKRYDIAYAQCMYACTPMATSFPRPHPQRRPTTIRHRPQAIRRRIRHQRHIRHRPASSAVHSIQAESEKASEQRR